MLTPTSPRSKPQGRLSLWLWAPWLALVMLLAAPTAHAQPALKVSAEQEPPAAPTKLEVLEPLVTAGEVIGEWTVERVEARPEFQRIFLTSEGDTTGVEVTRRRGDNAAIVQPAPDMAPPQRLLEDIKARADAVDWQWVGQLGSAAEPEDPQMFGGPNPTRWTWPLLLLAFLAVAGNEARWALRSLRSSFAHWTPYDTLLVGALSAGIMWFCRDYPLLHDATYDLQLGVMVAAGASLSEGVTSSVGLAQGALWAHLLGAAIWMGVKLQWLPWALATLQITVLVLWWRRLTELCDSRVVVACLALIAHTLLIINSIITRFQHDVLLWPAAVLFALSIDRALRTGRLSAFALSAFAFAFCVEAHLSALQFAPVLVVAAAWGARRSALDVALKVVLVVGITGWTEAMFSLGSLTRLLDLLVAHLPAPRLSLLALALGVVALCAAARFAQRKGLCARRGIALTTAAIVVLGGGSILIAQHRFPLRYFLLAIPLLTVFGPVDRIKRGSILSWVMLPLGLLISQQALWLAFEPHPRPQHAWTLTDVGRLEPVLTSFGNYSDLLVRLRTTGQHSLLIATANASKNAPPNPDENTALELLRVPDNTTVPPNWTRVRLRGPMDAVYRVQQSALPTSELQVCVDGECDSLLGLAEAAAANVDGAFGRTSGERVWFEASVTPGLPTRSIVALPGESARLPLCIPDLSDAQERDHSSDTLTLGDQVERIRFSYNDRCPTSPIYLPGWIEFGPEDHAIAEVLSAQIQRLRERDSRYHQRQ